MKKSGILYEPLPIGRIGIRKDDEKVVITNDFSCFAHILEEYISFGAVDIVMPKSAPEITTLNQMPPLLRKRIKVVNDDNEMEAMRRLLFNLRKEFNVKASDNDDHFIFPKDMPRQLHKFIDKAHADVKRIALGFNNSIQVDIDPEAAIACFRYLRGKSTDVQTRIVLAQLEAILKTYGEVTFEAPMPPKFCMPEELISVFDRLINDVSYLEYSDSIARLPFPSTRDQALVELRELERGIRTNTFISTGWNYFSKVIKVWTGVPIPESSAIANIMKGRSLPPLVNMMGARNQAVEMWKKSDLKNTPLRRDGRPVVYDGIHWLPPLDSMGVNSLDDISSKLGTVGELKKALEKAETIIGSSDEKKDI